jgi:hypothetical protein
MQPVHNSKKTTEVFHVYKVLLDFEGGIPAIIRQISRAKYKQIRSRILVAASLPSYLSSKEKTNPTIKLHKTFSFGNLASMPIAPLFPFWLWLRASKVDIVD